MSETPSLPPNPVARSVSGTRGVAPARSPAPLAASDAPAVQEPRRPERHRLGQRNYAKEKSRFVEFLGTKKLKLTRQREVVLQEVFGGLGHFEAEEMVERLKAKRSRVSRATVYRTLDLLQECQLVEKVNFGTSRSFYEHVHLGEHHDHMICTRCNVVIEFYDRRLEALQDEICRKHGIALRSHSMRLFGECQVCRLGKDG